MKKRPLIECGLRKCLQNESQLFLGRVRLVVKSVCMGLSVCHILMLDLDFKDVTV